MDVKLVAFLLAATGLATAARIPSGSQIQIRLNPLKTQHLQSESGRDAFQALVIAPVVVEGRVAMSAAETVTGHVKESTAAANPDDQALLALAFDEIRDASGKKASIAAKLAAIDNARESLDSDGRILGIVASKTGSGRLDQGINKVSEKYPSFAELLGTVKQAVLKENRRQYRFQSWCGNDHRAGQAAGLDELSPVCRTSLPLSLKEQLTFDW